MNLLYIITTHLILDTESGVYKKIKSQTDELVLSDVQIKVVCFSSKIKVKQQLFEHCTVFPLKNASSYAEIIDVINEHANCTTKILFRYPFASKQLLELVCTFPNQIYFEHNTFEETEVLLNQKKHFKSLPFSISPSYFKYWFNTYLLKNTDEKIFGKQILKYAKAGICVTNEIAQYEKARFKNYKTTVISNGANKLIDEVADTLQLTNTLKAFMLVGDDSPWQGVDRIVKGLECYNGKYNIVINIIGIEDDNINSGKIPDNCKIVFSKRDKDYFNKYKLSEYHFSFSTLALYKKKMNEASSLKLRHSMLMGFPVVLGYNDTDVTNNVEFKPFIFQVENNDSTIDFNKIIDFYLSVSKIENYPTKIRQLAEQTFSYKVKAQQLINFLKDN